jgi:hypothetical protein
MEVVMTDNIRDAIVALQNGDSSVFKSVVQDSLMNKAMDAIQIQRISAGQSMFDEVEEPQDNEVDTDEEV